MGKDSFFKQLVNHAIFWAPLLTIFYFALIFLSFWYQLIVLQFALQYIFYVVSAGIVIGYVLILFFSRQHIALRLAILVLFTPLFCLGSLGILFFPTVLAKEQLSNQTYYLTSEPALLNVHTYLHLYKCRTGILSCQRTPYVQGDPSQDHFRLMADPENDEIHILAKSLDQEDTLIYTYGTPPRYYEDSVQIKDRLYYLAFEDGDRSNPRLKYMLYECDLNIPACQQIPFRYTMNRMDSAREKVFLLVNETSVEVRALVIRDNKDKLVFTYGENPHCYVKDCEILKK